MRSSRRSTCEALAILLVCISPVGRAGAQEAIEIVEFSEFVEGTLLRDQYLPRGLRLKGDPPDGPFIDDAGAFDFLLDTPPGLLSLNPLAAGSGPSVVHASVGTYVFEFVNPDEPLLSGTTTHVDAVVFLADAGTTVLTAFDESGDIVDADTLVLGDFSFETHRLRVAGPGIRSATLTTPLGGPTLGALVDTLTFERPTGARVIDIDVSPGTKLNVIRISSGSTVKVAILSSLGFQPVLLDPAQVRFQGASAFSSTVTDVNGDRVGDLVLRFRASDLVGLTPASTQAILTAVDSDGSALAGVDDVIVRAGPGSVSLSAESGTASPRILQIP